MAKKESKLNQVSNEEFEKIVCESHCIREIVAKLGFSIASGSMAIKVKERIKEQNLDTSHFKPFSRTNTYKHELVDILTENSAYCNGSSLKLRLIHAGLLQNKCALCGNTGEWNGKPLSLQLHHINGIHIDNRLENIQLLCPNCHSQTESFGGRNVKK